MDECFSGGHLTYLHTTTKISVLELLPNGRWENRELKRFSNLSKVTQPGRDRTKTDPPKRWALDNCDSPSAWGAQGEIWIEVPVPNKPPSWHHSVPPASQGHDQEEACQSRFQGHMKGRSHRERSQPCSQDLFVSLPCKDGLFIVHPLLLAGWELHGERFIPITLSCPCLAGFWKLTSHRWLCLPALSIALCSVPEVWEAANGHHVPPGHPLAHLEIQPSACLPSPMHPKALSNECGDETWWPCLRWSSYTATVSWETRRNMSHWIMSLVIEGVASQHMAGKHNTRNFRGHSKLPADTVWVSAQQSH